MKHIFPEECQNPDCHLKCSLAKTCQKCGDKRVLFSDWRNFLPFVPIPIGLSLMYMGLAALVSRGAPLEDNFTPLRIIFSMSVILMPALAVSFAIAAIAWKKGSIFGIRRKCCLESCEADLFKGKCKKCGHPPAVTPSIFYYLAALIGLPAAGFGACMYASTPVTPVTSAVGNLGLIIAASAVLIGLIAWTMKR